MRIADRMVQTQVDSGLAKNRLDLADLQNKAAIQKRLIKPSDDPISAARVLTARTEVAGDVQFIKNSQFAKSFLNYTDQALSELGESLSRAKELALSQVSDASATRVTRQTVASEIEQIFWQAVQTGNRKLGDRFIFGGYKTTQAPFSVNGEYKGDAGEIYIQVNKDAFVSMNIPGAQVYFGENLSSDGTAHNRAEVERNIEDIKPFEVQNPQNKEDESGKSPNKEPEVVAASRRLASVEPEKAEFHKSDSLFTSGVNIFNVLKRLEISLRTNDKQGIQGTIDDLDEAIAQVILSRSEVGARVMSLDNSLDGLEKGKVESRTTASDLEDADSFALINDINRAETTLKTNLATSSKVIQPSLLDFLR